MAGDVRDVHLILVCANCGPYLDLEAKRWRAYLTSEEGEVAGVEVFCPACAREEFGDG